jgi:plasmid stabilization system protein ParE
VTVVLRDEARRRFEAEDEWWRENRDASDLFTADFESVLTRLARDPTRGALYRIIRGVQVRRVLMRKTRCYVYYCCRGDDPVVEVLTVWGARKRRGPKLDP